VTVEGADVAVLVVLGVVTAKVIRVVTRPATIAAPAAVAATAGQRRRGGCGAGGYGWEAGGGAADILYSLVR
jgi:hypothetical protein